MAKYFLLVKIFSRGRGSRVTRAAAYRAGERERRISPSVSTDDLDRDEIRATARDAETAGRFSFADRNDDLLVLRDLSVLTDAGFTQGGDVLFTRSTAQRHPQCRVQLLRSSGYKTGEVIDDIRWFEGPLVRVCRELLAAIEVAVPVQSTFPSHQARRIDRKAYDFAAIREGVVNAFVHRDYSAYSGGLRVSMFGSRIDIWNSGRLPGGLTPGALRRDHPSIPVNPDIAQVFYLRALMERIGRGTEKIIRAAKELRAPPPVWQDDPTGVKLTLFASRLSVAGEFSLNDRQKKLFMALQVGDEITLSYYALRFASEVTERQARRDLEVLERFGFLRRRLPDPATSYRLTPDYYTQI
jgi:ATP-dependent DNA helicase RecG